MAFFQPGTRRGIRGMTMGSRKTVPPRMLRMVPLGESHTVCFSLGAWYGRGGEEYSASGGTPLPEIRPE